MKKFVIFLRGVNVNGISIKMEELRNVMEGMLYYDVKTILASGNIIVTTTDDKMTLEDHKDKIETKLGQHFGYEAFIIIKTSEQITMILEESQNHAVPEGCHHYILLSNDRSVAQELKVQFELCAKGEKEQLILGDYGIYWIVPKGNTLQSDFGKKILGKKKFKNLLTSRTMNTIEKKKQYI